MLTYQQRLDSLVAELKKRGGKYESLTISKALEHLSMDRLSFPHILVGGTNGKGSVCRVLASVLSFSGKKTGLFITPHLLRAQERISIDGIEIQPEEFLKIHEKLEFKLKNFYEEGNRKLSFFESTFLVALHYFQSRQIDIAIIEVGLGGRQDACAALKPMISMVTNVSEDHLHILGPGLEDVAMNKSGLIFPGVPFYYGVDDQFKNLFKSKCEVSKGTFVSRKKRLRKLRSDLRGLHGELNWDGFWHEFSFGLRGDHQAENLLSALTLLALLEGPLRPKVEDILRALPKVSHSCRLEVFRQEPLIMIDGSHNQAGIACLLSWLDKVIGKNNIYLALGIKANKDHSMISKLLQGWKFAVYQPQGDQFLSLLKATEIYGDAYQIGPIEQIVSSFYGSYSPGKSLVFTGSLIGSAQSKEILESLISE